MRYFGAVALVPFVGALAGTIALVEIHREDIRSLPDLLNAVRGMVMSTNTALAKTGLTWDDITWFVPHQANKRIIDGSAHKLGIAPEKVVATVALHGNTSAASIPLALNVAIKDGRLKKGDLVLLEAMGGGFTWGAALVQM